MDGCIKLNKEKNFISTVIIGILIILVIMMVVYSFISSYNNHPKEIKTKFVIYTSNGIDTLDRIEEKDYGVIRGTRNGLIKEFYFKYLHKIEEIEIK